MYIVCYRLNNGIWKKYDIIAKYSSMIWNRRFYGVGSFQLTLPYNTDLQISDIILHGSNSGIVMKIVRNFENCTIYGYDLKGLTHFRLVEACTVSAQTVAETQFKSWATSLLATGNKAIEGLTVANSKGITTAFTEQTEIAEDKLDAVLEAYSQQLKIGWDITFSDGALTFDCIAPRDNKAILFGRCYKNVENVEFTEDNYDMVNNDGTGISRHEGTEKAEKSEYMTATALDIDGIDVKLGDYVTVKEFDKVAELQITELKYVYEPNNIVVLPSFGEVKQNLIKKLLK